MATVFDVLPRIGAGHIRFGMTRTDVRQALGGPVRTYTKSPGAPLTDTYFGTALQVAYDKADRVEYLELNGPGAVDPRFRGLSLLLSPAEQVLESMRHFAAFDADDPELGYSYVYPDLDLSLWRPVVPENPEDAEGKYLKSVGVGKAGYYARRSRSA